MTIKTPPPAILLLEDGTVFHGIAAGKIGTTTGEICFNTGMTGYQEVFTDPSYHRQILVTTNVHIGNYGIKDNEAESDIIRIRGLVCRNFNISYSRSSANEDIQSYFEREGLVGIQDIDTRAVVMHIRNKGAMNAIISSEELDLDILRKKLKEVPSMSGLELASEVSTKTPYTLGETNDGFKVAVLDFGVKRNILNCLTERNMKVKVFPAKTPFEEIEQWAPDGYMLSNGPGDPEPMGYAIELTEQILASHKPLMGICLGHQVLCLTLGMKSVKMFNGHRGINHPVKNLTTGHSEITSQNHGFMIELDSAKGIKDIEVTHVNLNDHSLEGIAHMKLPVFSVQYHPEASPGPHDSRYLFDNFLNHLEQYSATINTSITK